MARYVMNVLTQYMGTLNGVLQASGRVRAPGSWGPSAGMGPLGAALE